MTTPITIALTKGRLEKETIRILESLGIDCTEVKDKGRKLILQSQNRDFRFILVKAVDVLTYVEHGVADIGIVGKDVLLENGKDDFEMLDLQFGKCDFCLASVPSYDPESQRRKVIATKYPNVAAHYFRLQGQDVEIIKIEGSVEIAPLLGLADAIVDIVETGETLRENGLVIFDKLAPISARLIVNRTALKKHTQPIFDLIDRLDTYIENRQEADV
ncbi:ATP phosphoribosyltransferase [Brochothrix thermosphacta]|uniref:ATP phosphoribosyltransferase n=1 Tax=Brochothrix thermosphacta TaxID=2756 RepID=UPI00083FB424|nr:ATP phosphoribosyltransferase [Brochothrix thermosphacta]ANZ97739.1 ATP phosphoribosyltransferase [Brochothrix thermosphacta]ODJ66130.1 ATP phosphoribosyltransferase [Brochothrix thermosphacta]WKK70144.1 ATP phosphoribosyltransferase [Brochothrix thermosphacta]SOC29719.1 ATP phosphoribosyltransferase [Brochothrix thermosphacta]SPN71983.1 ATP phosphoribosyltransferase [Brochothrix thermosphacta]